MTNLRTRRGAKNYCGPLSATKCQPVGKREASDKNRVHLHLGLSLGLSGVSDCPVGIYTSIYIHVHGKGYGIVPRAERRWRRGREELGSHRFKCQLSPSRLFLPPGTQEPEAIPCGGKSSKPRRHLEFG